MNQIIATKTIGRKTFAMVHNLPGVVAAGSGARTQKESWSLRVTLEGNPCTYGRGYSDEADAKWAYVAATAEFVAA